MIFAEEDRREFLQHIKQMGKRRKAEELSFERTIAVIMLVYGGWVVHSSQKW